MTISRSIRVTADGISLFLNADKIPLSIHRVFFTHSSVNGQLGFFSCLSFCKERCDEHWGTGILLAMCFSILIHAQEWDCRMVCDSTTFNRGVKINFTSFLMDIARKFVLLKLFIK